ncbi:hypothetical protein V494_06838 [Pseudogymnoascus sp. VKM F-4513 (FW-928)]|nr:hypothetical protein V494_06838 [Pseudogymnoascus sp. VKM F-4513 (FW-928)]
MSPISLAMGEPQRPLALPATMKKLMNDPHQIQMFDEWKNNDGKAIHPGYGERTEFSPQLSMWIKPQTDKLEGHLSCAVKIDSSFKGLNSSWDDVLEYIQSSEKTYNAKAEKSWIRKYIRESKVTSQDLKVAAELLPDDMGLSVLRGGLCFMFEVILQGNAERFDADVLQAWTQRIDNRDNILQSLSEVPQILSYSSSNFNTYRKDVTLRNYIRDLYAILLESLNTLVGILLRQYDEGWLKKIRKQLPQVEALSVDSAINNIENAKQKIQNRVEVLLGERQADIDSNVLKTLNETKATREKAFQNSTQLAIIDSNLSENLNESKATHKGVFQNGTKLANLIDDVVGLTHGMNSMDGNLKTSRIEQQQVGQKVDTMDLNLQKYRSEVGDTQQAYVQGFRDGMSQLRFVVPLTLGETIQNALYTMGIETTYKQQVASHTIPRDRQLHYQPVKLFTEQLLAILQVDPSLARHEAEHILRRSSSMQSDALGKARWLLETSNFKQWFSRTHSGLLLVDGYGREHSMGTMSPLSVVCASLTATVAQWPGFIVLHFFCGEHSRPQDQVRGPNSLMASLIAQLILYTDIELDFVEHNLYEAVSRKDLSALCELFELLVVRVEPSKIICCIIDSISDFEANWGAEILGVVEKLRRLIDLQREGPIFKLLLTSANRTQNLLSVVNQAAGEHVSLRAGNSPGRTTRDRLGGNIQRPYLTSSPSRVSNFQSPRGAEEQRDYSYIGNSRGNQGWGQ